MIKYIRNAFGKIDYKLFGTLLLMGLLPTLYTTVRIFFLGQMPDEWGISIASQLSWVNLLYEIVQESLILPLFYFIGKAYKQGNEQLANRVRSGAVVVLAIYAVLSLLMIVFAQQLVLLMAQDISLLDSTVTYIRLETIANLLYALVKYFMVVLVTMGRQKKLLILLTVQMVLTILLDTFLVSTLSISANVGVNGIAYTNIIVNGILLVVAILMLANVGVRVISREKLQFGWMREFAKVGGLSGLETLVRNLAYMLVIIRMVNVVGEQGTFWIANNFIWGWLLLPVLQLGELVKRDCGVEGVDAVRNHMPGYIAITICIVVLWAVTIPLWQPFMSTVLQLSNADEVVFLVLISVGFYVLFAFNNVIDSIFYGLGRTDLMLVQSIVINTLYYGTIFVLYLTGIYVPTLTTIALMFAGGTALDSILTFVIYVVFMRRYQPLAANSNV